MYRNRSDNDSKDYYNNYNTNENNNYRKNTYYYRKDWKKVNKYRNNIYILLEKIKKTVSILTAPTVAIILLWAGKDESLIVGATAGLIVSAIDYAELFIKK